jgi:hypothetical protein
MRPTPLASRRVVVMRQAALAACVIFKHLHALEQHFACYPKWTREVRPLAYTFWGARHARIFLRNWFWAMCINYALSVIN